MQLSDGRVVPGNAVLDDAEIEARIEGYYAPYHRAIGEAIDAGDGGGQAAGDPRHP